MKYTRNSEYQKLRKPGIFRFHLSLHWRRCSDFCKSKKKKKKKTDFYFKSLKSVYCSELVQIGVKFDTVYYTKLRFSGSKQDETHICKKIKQKANK